MKNDLLGPPLEQPTSISKWNISINWKRCTKMQRNTWSLFSRHLTWTRTKKPAFDVTTSIVQIAKNLQRNDQNKQRFSWRIQQSQVWTSIRKNPRSVQKRPRTAWRNPWPKNWFQRKIFCRRDVRESWREVQGCSWKIEGKNPLTVRRSTWETEHPTTPN